MSSSRDAGYAAQAAFEIKQSKCHKAKDGEHDFEQKGSWPSSYGTCRYCGVTYYDK